MTTHLLLVTTSDESKRLAFHFGVALAANSFERRENTVNYAVGDESLESFLAHARNVGVTVQKIEHRGGEEVYDLLVGEEGSGWQRPSRSGGEDDGNSQSGSG